jgi:predicted aspartyl protease
VHAAGERRIPEAQVRRIVVDDERVDTGAAYVSMPLLLINQLGLKRLKTVQAGTAAGSVTFGIFEPVKLTIQGRDCEVRVAEVADNCPVLIGFQPLEQLDFIVDSKNQRLIGNPDHAGEFMIDMIAIHERRVPAV